MKVQLTQNKFALIDDEDFELISKYKWHARYNRGRWYTSASVRIKPGRGGYRSLLMHKLIMNSKDGEIVDHINGDGLDNRRSNLRICDVQKNLRNAKKYSGCSSQYKGVSWHKDPTLKNGGKWAARIKADKNKSKRLGLYKTEEEAALAYNKAALEFFGEFAKLNTIKKIA